MSLITPRTRCLVLFLLSFAGFLGTDAFIRGNDNIVRYILSGGELSWKLAANVGRNVVCVCVCARACVFYLPSNTKQYNNSIAPKTSTDRGLEKGS